jgi:tol-pal system protein YbgF
MNPIKRVIFFVFFLPFFLWFSGCASQGDLEAVQRDANSLNKEMLTLKRNVNELNQETREVLNKLEALGKKTEEVRQEISASQGKIGFMEKEMESVNQPMRRYQADLGARVEKLQIDVQNLMGRYEESKYFAQKSLGESKTIRESYQAKLDELDKQIASLKKSVDGLEPKGQAKGEVKGEAGAAEEEEKPSTAAEAQTEAGKPQPKGKTPEKPEKAEKKTTVASPDEAYKKAYDQFSKGDIEGAKAGFKKFLEAYPKSKYAENAHFWLAECYFAGKKYEEAILEYDEVIKKFPKGTKVPNALFRQGMAFLEMDDTTNAKLIFKEVVKRFPKSEQAKTATKKLKEM